MIIITDQFITDADAWIDNGSSEDYREQPLAQDWARVTKIGEEFGEAIAKLILITGQNPRKGTVIGEYPALLGELADVAITAIMAIQHFTKDSQETSEIFSACAYKIEGRVAR